ncbi:MAG: hypothetical protein AAFX05_09495 [Planctomycetota bacterium]
MLLGLAQLLAVGFVLALAIATWLVAYRLRRPPRKTYASALARGVPGDPSELPAPRAFDELTINLGGEAYPAWSIPGDAPDGPTIIYTPGWGDSKLGILPRLEPLLARAARIIAWDPPGQGDAPGRSALGVREPALLSELIDDVASWSDDDAPIDVVLFGASLGAGVSIVTAATRPDDDRAHIRAVLSEGAYRHAPTPAHNVLRLSGLPYRLNAPIAFLFLGLRLGIGPLWKGFDRAAHAARVRCPLLTLHGSADEVCPPADGKAIHAAADRGELVIIEHGGHNDLWTSDETSPTCRAAVDGFLAAHCAEAAGV